MPKDSKKKSISEIMPASKQKTIVDDANNTLMKLKKNGMGLEQALEHSLDEDMTMVSEYLKEMEKKGIYGTAGDEDLEHPEGLTPDQAAFFHSTNWIQYLNSEDKAAVADAFFRLLVTDYRKTVQTSFNALKKETNESTLKQAVATLQVFSDQLPPRCKGFMPNHQESPNAVFAILRNLSKMFLDLEPNFDMIDRYLKQKQAKSNVAKKQEFMIKWLQVCTNNKILILILILIFKRMFIFIVHVCANIDWYITNRRPCSTIHPIFFIHTTLISIHHANKDTSFYNSISNVSSKYRYLQFNECTKEEQEDIIEDLADECDMIRLGEIVTQLHVQHNGTYTCMQGIGMI